MAKKKTSTAEDKLRALFDLQIIDSRIDRLRVVRGVFKGCWDLPSSLSIETTLDSVFLEFQF